MEIWFTGSQHFNRVMKKLTLFLLLMVLLACEVRAETEAKKGFGLSIAPSVVRLKGKPGLSQDSAVRVFNNGVSPLQVLSEVSDVGNRVDENKNLVREFFPPGTLPFSCAKWILLREEEFILPPGESHEAKFLLSPPPDASGGSVCVVFFRGVPAPDGGAGPGAEKTKATIQIQPRLGAMIFHEVEGTVQRTGHLTDVSVEAPTAGSPLKLRYVFKNTGNADILITGNFYLLDADKALVSKADLKPIRTFPGDEGHGETEWTGNLSPGKYQLVITFELGPETQEVIVKELELNIA